MPSSLEERLREYRARTYRTAPGKTLASVDEAVDFVNERGFITFWPIKGVDLPNLWTAVAGNRPVADEHDDPGHITWRWKDSMLPKRRWYYGKYLRGKATLVSLDTVPYFYALSERVAEIDDYRLVYEDGQLTYEAFSVAEALLHNGAQHTIQLRLLSNLSSGAAKSRFDKALTDLQRGLWILPVGVAEAGSWHYAFIYELFDRWFPEMADKARSISRPQARRHLARLYLDSVGAVTHVDLGKLFRWPGKVISQTMRSLEEQGTALKLEDGRWISPHVTRT